jgi:hypothetical protein
MKKLIVLAICMALVGVMVVPLMASGASTLNIAITAQGSEIDITDNVSAWNVGTVQQGHAAYPTTPDKTWGRITNNGAEAVDITVGGEDMTGGAVTWTCAADGNGAAGSYGMTIVLAASTVVVKDNDGAMNVLVDELAGSGTLDYGMEFDPPTSGTGNEAMTMLESGLVFTASID